MKITASIKLEGGKLLTAANAHKIFAIRTDKTAPRKRWKIVENHHGFIFWEVTHGGGICGYHPNIRALVIATLLGNCGDDIEVHFEGGEQ